MAAVAISKVLHALTTPAPTTMMTISIHFPMRLPLLLFPSQIVDIATQEADEVIQVEAFMGDMVGQADLATVLLLLHQARAMATSHIVADLVTVTLLLHQARPMANSHIVADLVTVTLLLHQARPMATSDIVQGLGIVVALVVYDHHRWGPMDLRSLTMSTAHGTRAWNQDVVGAVVLEVCPPA